MATKEGKETTEMEIAQGEMEVAEEEKAEKTGTTITDLPTRYVVVLVVLVMLLCVAITDNSHGGFVAQHNQLNQQNNHSQWNFAT
ncbi:hypothetical protein Ddye_002449 [Dipteronia dyeriana]|uniref:Uncharacterized protein n=1 Tax=Dipteronia dyeriana TaxID=168575 RepID=A0AAD9XR52_9ROSI|nr:hypothetical protein Ddye_002449 [Dipteronia dyeriana]